ncbi:transmembrane amino acid transporter protein [Necator americanus]|uniref:Transmembrane amino acid transporter protein n=1 Tax=Necator americanus TaxID=51031 RepID=W2TZ22_NECAM|nr:transmembrane amino acid transporter protein [Necator americanus]ETN86267.1 transmembrane amino acid transporter protein [Necator americanus]
MQELFMPRIKERGSISPDQALIHMIKVMMGTGMLSLPLAFKHSGLWVYVYECLIAAYLVSRVRNTRTDYINILVGLNPSCLYLLDMYLFKSQPRLDYANVMRSAVEIGPPWIRDHGYFWKQVVNVNMFLAQLGFCCVYFVFMADNLKQFFDQTSNIHISQAGWIALLLVPIMGLCTIRELKALAPLAAIANVVYLIAVCIVLQQLFQVERPSWTLPAVGNWSTLPLFFGTVMFAFEGVAVVLPIENQMDEPLHFITYNGVLNTSCLLVLILYMIVGFFGYLRFGDGVMDTLTLNLPQTKVCLFCIQYKLLNSTLFQFLSNYQINVCCVYTRFLSFAILCAYGASREMDQAKAHATSKYFRDSLNPWIWIRNLSLMAFAVFGFATGTYASVVQIFDAFGKSDV